MKKLVLGLIAAAMAWTVPADAAPFFAGKQFRIVVGAAPGGGNDLFARIFPEYLGKYIEGNPTIIIENRPGAGGVTALNWFADVAPHDGTVAFVANGELVTRMVLGYEGVTAKIGNLKPLIGAPFGQTNYISAKTGYKQPKDILTLKEPLFLGVTDPLSTAPSVVALKLLKVPFKTIPGYPGKNDAMLAFLRGEVTVGDIATEVFSVAMRPPIEKGEAYTLFGQGMMEGDELVRDPLNPNVPSAAEFYKEVYGRAPTGPEWEAYKHTIRATSNAGKMLVIHKDTPPEVEAALLKAFADVQKDAAFVKGSASTLGGYGLTFGDALKRNVQAIVDMSPETKKWMQDLYTQDYKMKFSN